MPNQIDPTLEAIRSVYPYRIDLEDCDREPLHHIQVVQSQTCLLAIDLAEQCIRYVSDNSLQHLGIEAQALLDQPLDKVFNDEVVIQIKIGLNRLNGFDTLNPIQTFVSSSTDKVLKNIVVHRSGDYLVLEVEPVVELYRSSTYQMQLAQTVERIQHLRDSEELFRQTANILRRLTGYDRVMVYRFDEAYNGEVVAEAHREDVTPFLGLRYPHTDIPAQARELYLRNRIRIVGSISIPPARLLSSEGFSEPLDLSLAHSRGTSPIHIEYLSNMGVDTTMSIAIVVDGKLWGLFAMHHYSPRFLDYNLRTFLLFLGQVFSGHLAVQAAGKYREMELAQNMVRSVLGEQINSKQDVLEGLTEGRFNLLDLFPSTTGAAVNFDGGYRTVGSLPDRGTIEQVVDHFRKLKKKDLVYTCSKLSDINEDYADICQVAAGVMVMFIDPEQLSWIAWFRPETIQEVHWGGKPAKNILESPDGTRRLSPRKSFARYVEKVAGSSNPWTDQEINAAIALRIYIKDSVLRQFRMVQHMNTELKEAYSELESFSYTVSHDLRSPLRAIDGYSEILIEEFADKLTEEGVELLNRIQRNTARMNSFINDILEFSRIGRTQLDKDSVDVSALALDLIEELRFSYSRAEAIDFDISDDIPLLSGDEKLVRQLLQNLISNAIKYSEPDKDGKISVRIGSELDKEVGQRVFYVENTGSKIPEEFHGSVFDIFSRLHSNTDIEGSGVGLAIVSRIASRHGGSVFIGYHEPYVRFSFYLN